MTNAFRTMARLGRPLSMPISGSRWFPLWAVLRHQGRKSGRIYTTPVVARRTPDGFVIPIPFGEHTQWVRNVMAAGGCELRWKGGDYRLVDPETIDRAAAGASFNAFQRCALRLFGLDSYLRLRIGG